ncbi:hypothetical protein FB451DRAFT_1020191 [Mycena latifolia]|nr:hypothetical protein FB451DRAFT_1020191 [Mycena latifolia]
MHGSLIRRSLHGLVPPKIATPKLVVRCSPVAPTRVAPSRPSSPSPAPVPAIRGLKARFFSGKNASAAPVLGLIGGLFLIGYTMDYQRAFSHHKNHAH